MRGLACLLLGGCNWVFGLSEQPVPEPGKWQVASAGVAHICGITTAGQLACWGDDRSAQLGLPFAVATPRLVEADTRWIAVAAGVGHSCGIHDDGKVACWGANFNGQAGGTPDPQPVPAVVPFTPGAPAFEAVGVGQRHSCALGDGEIWCWGDSDITGTTTQQPDKITGPTWRALAVGFDHTCAIAADGGAWCWGNNQQAQVDSTLGAIVFQPAPIPIGPAIAIAAGHQTSCAVVGDTATATTGQVWCWGRNQGQVIDGGGDDPHVPIPVLDGDDWTGVVIGSSIACALRQSAATCWGTTSKGGLGDGTWSAAIAPTAATRSFPADGVTIGAGGSDEENVCALANGNLACWGDNRGGQLGLGPPASAATPILVKSPGGMAWTHLWAGPDHTCAQDETGATACWGADDAGQTSTTPGPDHPTPTALQMQVDQLVAGLGYTCVRTGTQVTCFGSDANGELGTADRTSTMNSFAVPDIMTLDGGERATCALRTSTMTPTCWGLIAGMPTLVPAATDFKFTMPPIGVRFGDVHACGLQSNGGDCFGLNSQCEIGTGSPDDTFHMPVTPFGIVSSYSGGALAFLHTCVIAAATVYCFGSDYYGESGAASPMGGELTCSATQIVEAAGALRNCRSASAGKQMSCAICDGVPKCWGGGAGGQLGRGDALQDDDMIAANVQVSQLEQWVTIAGGGTHTCALSMEGTVACWGLGVRGELGDGGHGSNVPVAIPAP